MIIDHVLCSNDNTMIDNFSGNKYICDQSHRSPCVDVRINSSCCIPTLLSPMCRPQNVVPVEASAIGPSR